MKKYFSALDVSSYNAIYTFIISNRNYGKTWCFKRRAWKRALKHGKKTLWIRRFQKEVKEAVSTFYASKDLLQWIGDIEPYDPTTKKGNLKQVGRTFYIKRGKRWEWFLKVAALSDSNALRSADDVDCDTIIFDEFTTTPQKYKRYRGSEVDDFVDAFFSGKREHEVRCFFMGNKESISNPYFTYFGIPSLPKHFEGIRTFREGSIAVQQINNKPKTSTNYDKKVAALLRGTPYGRYIYEDEYKTAHGVKPRKTPANASEYIQLNWNSNEIKISILNGFFYVNKRIDKTRRVYTDTPLHKYKNEFLLVKRQKKLFNALIDALADSRIYYENEAAFEALLPFFQWLGAL